MATVQFELEVQGGGEVELGVAILSKTPVVLTGLETQQVDFTVSNPLARLVVLTLSIVKEGPSKDKASVSLLSNSMTITPGATVPNRLIIEANQAMLEGDTFLVRVTGVENA